jgi:hypothetical protein
MLLFLFTTNCELIVNLVCFLNRCLLFHEFTTHFVNVRLHLNEFETKYRVPTSCFFLNVNSQILMIGLEKHKHSILNKFNTKYNRECDRGK